MVMNEQNGTFLINQVATKFFRMRNGWKFFVNCLQWLFSLNGLIFFRRDEYEWIKFILLVAIHSFYLWCITRMGYYLDKNLVFQRMGYLKFAFYYGRIADLIGVTMKLVWYCLHARKFEKYIILSKMYDENMKKYGASPKEKLSKVLIGLVTFFLFALSLDIYSLSPEKREYMVSWIFPHLKDVVEFCMMGLTLSKFREMFFMINKQYSNINRVTNYRELFPLTKAEKLVNLRRNDTLSKILIIRKLSLLHHEIVSSVLDLSRIYTFPIVVTLCVKTFDIVNCVYYIILSTIFQLPAIVNIVRPAVWIAWIALMTVVIIHIWYMVEKEGNRTVLIVHDIWNNHANGEANEKNLLFLQFISMRFLANKLKFTAYGFFPLDWSILYSMVASVTTYMIILIQLKK